MKIYIVEDEEAIRMELITLYWFATYVAWLSLL